MPFVSGGVTPHRRHGVKRGNLSPVALDEHVAVTATLPTMIDPSCVSTRRGYPHTRHPYVSISIPTVIAALINIPFMRGAATLLNHRTWRRYLHDNLGVYRADSKQAACNRGQESFLHFSP